MNLYYNIKKCQNLSTTCILHHSSSFLKVLLVYYFSVILKESLANSADTDQTPQNAPSNRDLTACIR